MQDTEVSTMQRTDIKTPVRNRYFYGKLLDAFHFELETNYFNAKRWLLNRLITGYGVVCGLDVQFAPQREGIVITSGVAIDKWGREIIVPKETEPIPIPPEFNSTALRGADTKQQQKEEEEEEFVKVLICYHECESDPTPVLAGDCSNPEPCAPGAIRERYKVIFKPGCAPPILIDKLRIPDVISGGRIDYPALAKWVTGGCSELEGCSELPENPCIPLANIRISSGEKQHGCGCRPEDIDITIRPIVYTNDLLFQLLLSLLYKAPKYKKQK